jgi:hypothetical protein
MFPSQKKMSYSLATVVVMLGIIVVMSAILFICNFRRVSAVTSILGLIIGFLVNLPRLGMILPLTGLYRYEGDYLTGSGEVVFYGFVRLPHTDGNLWIGAAGIYSLFMMMCSLTIFLYAISPKRTRKIMAHFQTLRRARTVIHADDFLPRVK